MRRWTKRTLRLRRRRRRVLTVVFVVVVVVIVVAIIFVVARSSHLLPQTACGDWGAAVVGLRSFEISGRN